MSFKFASQICHEDTNTPLDGAYLSDFGIDIIPPYISTMLPGLCCVLLHK